MPRKPSSRLICCKSLSSPTEGNIFWVNTLTFYSCRYRYFNENKHLNLLNLQLIECNWSTIFSNQCCWLQPHIDAMFLNTPTVDICYLLFTLLVRSSWLFSTMCCQNKVHFGIICGWPSIHLILNSSVPQHFHELITHSVYVCIATKASKHSRLC